MKVLLTGANGMLGQDLQQVFASNQEHALFAYERNELDIANRGQVQAVIASTRPDLIINAAAFTNVDGCETAQAAAFAVNAEGPLFLAQAANAVGAKLVHISTDYVFSGQLQRPYVETDACQPLGVYGQSKWAGEEAVREYAARHFILRTSWLVGVHGKNFVATMLELGKKQSMVKVVNDQTGSPTFTLDLARAIYALLESDQYGTYHVTNSGACTWYEFAKLIFTLAAMPVGVAPIRTEELGRPAPRPAYSVLDNAKWVEAGFPPLRPYGEALREFLASDFNLTN